MDARNEMPFAMAAKHAATHFHNRIFHHKRFDGNRNNKRGLRACNYQHFWGLIKSFSQRKLGELKASC